MKFNEEYTVEKHVIKFIHKTIRFKCFDCMAGGKRFDCKSNNCPLFLFRPWAKKEIKSKNSLNKIIYDGSKFTN